MALALGPVATGARAAPDDAGPRWSVEAGAVRSDYRADERGDSGERLTTESGRLSGQRLALTAWSGGWPLRLAVSHQQGTLGYLGRSQFGFPLVTATRLALDSWTLGTEHPVWAGGTPASGLWLTAALGERRIDRRILPSPLSTALTERLRSRFLQFGAEARGALPAGWQARASAGLEQGLGSRLAVDFHGLYDPTDLSPGHAQPGWWWGLQAQHALAAGWQLRLHADGALQRHGASPWQPQRRNGDIVGQVRYPGSVQRQGQLGVSLVFEAR